ncbi:MAG: hypothetical protein IAG13_01765 [Deltaproteobacteria bacterium]|nr:hypothetical protein [Nannocystaceae bacterium]
MSNSAVCSPALTTTSIRRRELSFALAALVALTPACKKDEPATDTKTADGKSDPAKPDGKTDPAKPGEPAKPGVLPGVGINPADQPLTPATKLQRGEVLGHFLIPNPSTLLVDVKTQVVPAAQASFVDESFLRTMGGGALGSRSGIATHLDLTKPFACALVDLAAAPVPVACIVGYTGGAAALVTDLGAEGKQADAAGHIAKFVIEGQEIYVDELGGDAVVSNHTEVFAKAKGYLETNVVARAGSVATDVEVVAFASSLMKRYEAELAPVLGMIGKVPPPSAGGSKFADAMAAYGVKANARTVDSFKQMDQVTFAFGLEPIGFVMRFASFPMPGSELETQAKTAAAGPLDTAVVKNLPATSWAVIGFNSHLGQALETAPMKELRNVFVDAYAAEVGKDKAATEAAVDAFIADQAATYSGQSAAAFMHEPGSLGGFAIVRALQAGKESRESWKTWSSTFTPESVLGAEAAKKITWSFQMDAAKVGEVAVDRWTIEPTEESKKEMRTKGGEELAKWEPRLGGLKLVINRAESDGKVAFVVSPGSDDKYAKAVVDALAGTTTIGSDPGLTTILERNAGVSAVFGLSVKGVLAWASEIVPPEEFSKIPPGLGNDLSDMFVVGSYGDTGAQSGEFVVSQRFIDQLRALAK